jgi:peptide-methionine (R)-S-oxide reductase
MDSQSDIACVGRQRDGKVIQYDDSGQKVGPIRVKKVRNTDDEWKQQLTPLQFQVTRKEGTERAFTGEYFNLHDNGLYRCVCCNNALFNSDSKFESGTGWPSFWAPIAKENVRRHQRQQLGDEPHRGFLYGM